MKRFYVRSVRVKPAVRRMFSIILIFWVTITINFLLPRLIPGDGLTLLHADAESMGISLSHADRSAETVLWL